MLAALLLATAGTFAWQCRTGGAECLTAGWEEYLTAFIAALVANQAAHSISPLPAQRRAVRQAAATRNLPR
jgi:hypothetical protein